MRHVTEDQRESAEVAPGVHLADLATTQRASMKFWRVEPGATLPAHRHENEQVGFVISGSMVAILAGEEQRLQPGDSYAFSGGEYHGAENRGDVPCLGIGVLAPPREQPEWGTSTEATDGHAVETDD